MKTNKTNKTQETKMSSISQISLQLRFSILQKILYIVFFFSRLPQQKNVT